MLRRQSMIALGIALVLALVAVYLANVFLTARAGRSAPIETVRVAVAAVPLDYGVVITPDKVRFAEFPSTSIPPGTFRSMGELLPGGKQRLALRPIQVNELILASKLTGEGHASIAALLPDGKRAAAVKIDAVSGVAGFVQPNDSVDVLVTRQAQGGSRGEQVTDILLQNVRVMAIDQDARESDGQPSLGRTATLEVDPIGAQKLALAQQVGKLSLTLRKPGPQQDSTFVETVSLDDLRYNLYGPSAPRPSSAARTSAPTVRRTVSTRSTSPRPAPARTGPAPPAPTTSSVEVVRGTAGSQYEVGNYGS